MHFTQGPVDRGVGFSQPWQSQDHVLFSTIEDKELPPFLGITDPHEDQNLVLDNASTIVCSINVLGTKRTGRCSMGIFLFCTRSLLMKLPVAPLSMRANISTI
jgi:hypothetical protein